MKKFLILLVTLIYSDIAFSQISVKENSFHKIDGFVMLDKNDHYDNNDRPMALIKIATENITAEERRKFIFKGNLATYFDVQFKTSEIYLYISTAATFIEIHHPDFSKIEYWLPEDLCDFCGYEMIVEYTPKKEEAELIVSGNMDNSLVYIDDKLLGIKEAKKMSEVGATHTWKIKCEGYQTESGTVTLDGKTEIYKVLKSDVPEVSLVGTNNKTKKQNRFFLGINAGAGGGIHKGHRWEGEMEMEKYKTLQYSLGLDMAFPLNNTLSLGAFASVGMESSKVVDNPRNKIDVSVGPLVNLNFKNNSAALIGFGVNIYKHSKIPIFDLYGESYIIMENENMNIGYSCRIGFQFPSKFYMMGEYIYNYFEEGGYHRFYDYSNLNNWSYIDIYFHCSNYAFLLHFGYRIF